MKEAAAGRRLWTSLRSLWKKAHQTWCVVACEIRAQLACSNQGVREQLPEWSTSICNRRLEAKGPKTHSSIPPKVSSASMSTTIGAQAATKPNSNPGGPCFYVYIYIYLPAIVVVTDIETDAHTQPYTHTHTRIYVCIYIYIDRETDR